MEYFGVYLKTMVSKFTETNFQLFKNVHSICINLDVCSEYPRLLFSPTYCICKLIINLVRVQESHHF